MVKVLYCGCMEDKGHYTHADPKRPYRHLHGDEEKEATPFGILDSSAYRSRGHGKQGEATLTHEDGWTLLSIHDYTVDDRGGSHSTFAIEAPELDLTEAVEAARAVWPRIVKRLEKAGEIQ